MTAGQVIAIDGKQLRRSHDHGEDKAAIHAVSAWATANELVLDVAFREDGCRIRKGHSPQNFALLRP